MVVRQQLLDQTWRLGWRHRQRSELQQSQGQLRQRGSSGFCFQELATDVATTGPPPLCRLCL